MFKRIVVAYDASAESRRALVSAIRLAQTLGSELHAVTICEPSTVSASFVNAVAPSLGQTLVSDQRNRAERRLAEARETAGNDGIDLATHLVEGQEVEEIISCVNTCKADLLVLGIHQHSLYVSRLWSTVYTVALDSPCSVLGVH
jgi:nucleotide-binding universal stress UspA family protein